MEKAKQADDTAARDAEPPRQEVEHFGEPVAEEQIEDEYWEVYSPEGADKIFVAYYRFESDEWVKHGLDRHRVSKLFNAEGWPTN